MPRSFPDSRHSAHDSTGTPDALPARPALAPFVAAMVVIVASSNFLVQYPFGYFDLGDILTWGAFTYPAAFLVNDLTNRRFGPEAARKVVLVGFAIAVVLSVWLSSPRIAMASGTAFLAGQMLDLTVFNRLRRQSWWRAPLLSTIVGSALDTVIFFSLAFSGHFAVLDTMFGLADGSLAFPATLFGAQVPLWISLALGDFSVKLAIGLAMLVPYGAFLSVLRPAPVLR